jgi:predicted metal-dependent phosphoesterase TrpH
VRRAAATGVGVLALTDHDDLTGLAEAQATADECGVRLVPGVEISITWGGITIHIVGLGVDPGSEALARGLEHVRASRARRAERIAAEFDALGMPGTLEGAYSYAANPNLVGRAHFARFLVERGVARDVRSVFHRYLVAGKPAYVPHQWAELADAVAWIRASGGRAVVAHPPVPAHARGAAAVLHRVHAAGGEAVEVVTGSHTRAQYVELAGSLASSGCSPREAPTPRPEESEIDLGQLPLLPADLKPVWHDWA